jgi:hypothetical protein
MDDEVLSSTTPNSHLSYSDVILLKFEMFGSEL